MSKHLSIAESIIPLPSTPEARRRRRDRIPLLIGASATTAVALVGAAWPTVLRSAENATTSFINLINDIDQNPTFSTETVTKQADSTDRVWNIAGEVRDPNNRATRGAIVTYIMNMPENKKTFEDGQLSDNEYITRPSSVE